MSDTIFTTQMFDYGISLRLDKGKHIIKKLLPVLKMLMLFKEGKSCEYIQGIMFQLHLLDYHKTINSPTWQMFKNQASVFNEESGEVSFSILARTVLGHSNKADIDHMNDRYKQINSVREIDDALVTEGGAVFKSDRNWRKEYTKDSEQVTTVAEFMKSRIRDIASGNARMYDGSKESYKSKVKAADHQVPFSKQKRFWLNGVKGYWDKYIERMTGWTDSSWGAQLVDIWPEMSQDDMIPTPPISPPYNYYAEEDGDVVHPDFAPDGTPGEQHGDDIRYYPRGTDGVTHEAPPGYWGTDVDDSGVESEGSMQDQSDEEPVEEAVEEVRDPRLDESWKQQGNVHSGLIISGRRKRSRKSAVGPDAFLVQHDAVGIE